MGRDKALLEAGGQPLLVRQINLAWATRATEVFISGRAGVDYSHFNCPVLLDKLPRAGPPRALSAHWLRSPMRDCLCSRLICPK